MTTEQESTLPPPVKGSMTATKSTHRAAPAPGIVEGHLAAVGLVVAALHGNDSDAYSRSAAIEFMALQLDDFREPTSAQVGQRLALHLPVIEALMLHFAKRAATSPSPEASAKFAKIAMQAQSSFARTVEVLADLQKLRPHDIVEPEGEGEGE